MFPEYIIHKISLYVKDPKIVKLLYHHDKYRKYIEEHEGIYDDLIWNYSNFTYINDIKRIQSYYRQNDKFMSIYHRIMKFRYDKNINAITDLLQDAIDEGDYEIFQYLFDKSLEEKKSKFPDFDYFIQYNLLEEKKYNLYCFHNSYCFLKYESIAVVNAYEQIIMYLYQEKEIIRDDEDPELLLLLINNNIKIIKSLNQNQIFCNHKTYSGLIHKYLLIDIFDENRNKSNEEIITIHKRKMLKTNDVETISWMIYDDKEDNYSYTDIIKEIKTENMNIIGELLCKKVSKLLGRLIFLNN